MTTSLADQLGRHRADVIPGYFLSEPDLQAIADSESSFERDYLAAAFGAAATLPAPLRKEAMDAALEKVAGGIVAFGSRGFEERIIGTRYLGFVTWLSLRVKHPQVKPAEVPALVMAAGIDRVSEAVADLWGYGPRPKAQPPPTGERGSPSSSSPPTGAPSSGPSDEGGSAETPRAA